MVVVCNGRHDDFRKVRAKYRYTVSSFVSHVAPDRIVFSQQKIPRGIYLRRHGSNESDHLRNVRRESCHGCYSTCNDFEYHGRRHIPKLSWKGCVLSFFFGKLALSSYFCCKSSLWHRLIRNSSLTVNASYSWLVSHLSGFKLSKNTA